MYKVIYKEFEDLEDPNRHIYTKNDIFPCDGREISEERLEQLLTDKNKIGVPLIAKEEIEDPNDTKTDDNTVDTQGEDENTTGTDGNADDTEVENLTEMKRPQLQEIAKSIGIDFKVTISNADLINLIEVKRKENNQN